MTVLVAKETAPIRVVVVMANRSAATASITARWFAKGRSKGTPAMDANKDYRDGRHYGERGTSPLQVAGKKSKAWFEGWTEGIKNHRRDMPRFGEVLDSDRMFNGHRRLKGHETN